MKTFYILSDITTPWRCINTVHANSMEDARQGHMDYSGESVEEYLLNNPDHVLVGDDQINRLILQHEKSLLKKPFKQITKEDYWEALECLPPVRHTNFADGSGSYFFISEASYMTVHAFYVKKYKKYYTKNIDIYTSNKIIEKMIEEL